ncbi:hypothetical protein [Chitinibacter sp. S2-10]|uniref:hypothetical protein n=1 Tax=Chitinibacter sp. S2-10 TaxID=3373597 RepID=UPI003977C203
MKVFNDAFNCKLELGNKVLRRLREQGVGVLTMCVDNGDMRLHLESEPPAAMVPPRIHKVRGMNVAKLDGVTLVWGDQS